MIIWGSRRVALHRISFDSSVQSVCFCRVSPLRLLAVGTCSEVRVLDATALPNLASPSASSSGLLRRLSSSNASTQTLSPEKRVAVRSRVCSMASDDSLKRLAFGETPVRGNPSPQPKTANQTSCPVTAQRPVKCTARQSRPHLVRSRLHLAVSAREAVVRWQSETLHSPRKTKNAELAAESCIEGVPSDRLLLGKALKLASVVQTAAKGQAVLPNRRLQWTFCFNGEKLSAPSAQARSTARCTYSRWWRASWRARIFTLPSGALFGLNGEKRRRFSSPRLNRVWRC